MVFFIVFLFDFFTRPFRPGSACRVFYVLSCCDGRGGGGESSPITPGRHIEKKVYVETSSAHDFSLVLSDFYDVVSRGQSRQIDALDGFIHLLHLDAAPG